MLWPKKNSYKEFDNEKKFLRIENPPPPTPLYNFSNGPSLNLMLMVVYHLQKVPEMRLERWWNTTFRVFPAENFREQRNVWKGSPVFSVAMFQTEI